MPDTITIDYKGIARKVYGRLGDATGDAATPMVADPNWAEDYGEEFAKDVRRVVRESRDPLGTIADMLFNQDGFWEMAMDWIGDELTAAGVGWKDPEYDAHYNAVCDALALQASFKSTLILSWKRKIA